MFRIDSMKSRAQPSRWPRSRSLPEAGTCRRLYLIGCTNGPAYTKRATCCTS